MAKGFEQEDSMNEGEEKRERATIGPSISIRGEVTGSEDLLIEGAIDGTVDLKDNTVTVGRNAKVNANILGNIIHVEGEVAGDLYGREQVIVHKSGCVRGNITAPRLSLEDGARLKGSIDTEPNSEGLGSTLQIERVRSAAKPATEPAKKAAPAAPAARPGSSSSVQ